MTDLPFILRVLGILSDHDQHDDLWWRTDNEYAPVQFFINCNDVFWWGCADGERITPENVDMLEAAYADCKAASRVVGTCYGGMLFCCRVRKMRPQGCCYPSERELWPLFDACGPERAIDAGNPYLPGKGK